MWSHGPSQKLGAAWGMQTNAINPITINFLRESPKRNNNKVNGETFQAAKHQPWRRGCAVRLSGISQEMFVLSVADKTKKQRNLILHRDSDYNHIMWSKFVNSPDKEWPVAFWAELCGELWPYRIPLKAQLWPLLTRAFKAAQKNLWMARHTKRTSVKAS